MKLAGIDVDARSVGGVETCIQLPAMNLCFDIGRCPKGAINLPRIFLTHAHMDHAAGLAYHASQRDLMGRSAPTYYVPHSNLADFEALFEVYRRLDCSQMPCQLKGIGPGDCLELTPKRKIMPFRSPHRVFCQGYAVQEQKQKLRPEFLALSGQEIHQLRLGGTQVSDEVTQISVAFTGDTLIEVVEREEAVRKARLLIMEATFLDNDVSVGSARSKGHIHLDEIIDRAELFENEHILLTHFSARYSPQHVRDILERKLPESLRTRVTPLLQGA